MNILKKKTGSDKTNWVADEEVKLCPLCQAGFNLTTRRHHCRKCGGVFCGKCAGSTAVLKKGQKAERVCTPCFTQLLEEDEKEEEERQERKKVEQQKKSADTNFVIHVYDKEGLIHDIVKFLKGDVLAEVVLCGVKVPCSLFISEAHLCIKDKRKTLGPAKPGETKKNDGPAEPVEEKIALADFQKIRLGTTKAIKSCLSGKDAERSFSIDTSTFIKCTGDKKTLGIVCRELADFEAWVLGLCHLTRITPTWDQKSKVDRQLTKSLPAEEVEYLQKHQISSETYRLAKTTLEQRRESIKHHLWVHDGDVRKAWSAMGKGNVKPFLDEHGAVYCTKGELRHITTIDIFRACSLWELMSKQHLLFDPNYIPSVGEGSEAAAVRKKPQSKEYRIDPVDGQPYTKQQFVDEYNGTKEWDEAPPYTEEEHRRRQEQKLQQQQQQQQAPPPPPAEDDAPPPPPEEAAAEREASPSHVDPAAAGEDPASPEADGGLTKEEKKRLKKILFAAVTGVVALVQQAAYEEKRAAKKAKKKKQAEEAAEAEAEVEAQEEDEEEAERERRRREKKAKKEKKRREREAEEAAEAEKDEDA